MFLYIYQIISVINLQNVLLKKHLFIIITNVESIVHFSRIKRIKRPAFILHINIFFNIISVLNGTLINLHLCI